MYEEALDSYDLMNVREEIKKAKTLLVIGSGLKVNPAASLVHDFFVRNAKYDGDVIEFVKKTRKSFFD